MNSKKLEELSANYLTALRAYVDSDAKSSLSAVLRLGERAVAMGMETLDIAKLHDQVLSKLMLPEYDEDKRTAINSLAMLFFNAAIRPIEDTHRPTLDTNAKVDQLNESLTERTDELARTNAELRMSIDLDKTAPASQQASLMKSEELLKDSRELEEHLRQTAHDIMTSVEEGRTKMSLKLNDEIAQTMLGIHIRVITLKQEVALNHTNLTEEIAETQQLVEESVKSVKRFARELDIPVNEN